MKTTHANDGFSGRHLIIRASEPASCSCDPQAGTVCAECSGRGVRLIATRRLYDYSVSWDEAPCPRCGGLGHLQAAA